MTSLGAFHQKVTIPYTFYADECPAFDRECAGAILKFLREIFAPGATPRRFTCVSSLSDGAKPVDGVPFAMRSRALCAFNPKAQDLQRLDAHCRRNEAGAIETLNGAWGVVELPRSIHSAGQYIVLREGKPWFTTTNYNFVLRSLSRYIAKREVALAA